MLKSEVILADEIVRELMGRVHPPAAAKPVDFNRLRPGTRVRITYEAEIAEAITDFKADDGYLPLIRQTASAFPEDSLTTSWYESTHWTTVEILPPDVVPGCILQAGGATWVVRKSNNRDSYRVQPVNLAGRLKTIPIEDFAARYPTAKVTFDPRKSYKEIVEFD